MNHGNQFRLDLSGTHTCMNTQTGDKMTEQRGTIVRNAFLLLTITYIMVNITNDGYNGLTRLYDQWRNALHIGAAYFVYQLTDDIPHLVAGRSPVSEMTPEGKRINKPMSKEEIPKFMISRVMNHLSKTMFVIIFSQILLSIYVKLH